MKRTIKNLIIIFSILILIIIFAILINNKKQKDSNNNYEDLDIPEEKYTKLKEKYECNEFEYIDVTIEQLLVTYFNKYKENIAIDIEKSYNMLDDEYKITRFKNIDEYKVYIGEKYNDIVLASLTNYKQDNSTGEYTLYTCLDQNGNYYIFKETAIMQYTIFLDKYTIDFSDFIERYDSGSTQEKVVLNIEKIKQALNAKDYTYVYNKLANSFKENNYKKQEELENFAKENLFDYNEISYHTFANEGETYIYNISMRNRDNAQEQKEMQIIMRLKENRDFEIAFSIK